MTTSIHILGVPDGPGGPFLRDLNGVIQALTTMHASSSEPPIRDRCMGWFDLGTNIIKVRNSTNAAWVSLFRVSASGAVPLLNGLAITGIATLEASARGYVYSNGQAFLIQDVDSPDIPLFGVNKAGMVPGPSSAQAQSSATLRADGGWGLGLGLVASRQFAGALDYPMTVPRASAYKIAVRAALSNSQPLVMQIGSGGSPTQSGYTSSVTRSEGSENQSEPELLGSGFQLWNTYAAAGTNVLTIGDLISGGGNTWFFVAHGGNTEGGRDGDVARGYVSLNGPLDYIRVLPAGSPRGSYGNRASMNQGSISVYI